jgi:hypothetical protein
MWRGPYYNHWFLGAQIISIFLNIFPSLAEAEKIYSPDPPMIAKIVWPIEGNYCLLPPNPGIPCVLKVVDYDTFSVPNIRNLTVTNLEQTVPGNLQAYWRVEPKDAGNFQNRSYNGFYIIFIPNPNYRNGQGGPVTLIATIRDNDPISSRRDSSVIIKCNINLSPKPAIHEIKVESVLASNPTVVIDRIPFTSGQAEAKKVKWRLIGVRSLPSSFMIITESWQVEGIGNFNGNPILTDIISHDKEHGNITITFTFIWKNSITGEQGTDVKSISVPICFHLSDFDEQENSPRGYSSNGYYHEPPNWFDDRPSHWPAAINGLGASYVYYRTSDPEDNPWWGTIHYGWFDWSGQRDPTGQNRLEYRGRIYIYSSAATIIIGHGYRPETLGIDSCGIVINHEMRHKEVFEAAWDVTYPNYTDEKLKFPDGRWKPFSGIKGIDFDSDAISDWYEDANREEGWNPYKQYAMHYWFDYATSEPLMKDPEFDAVIRGEFRFLVGSKDMADWSHDGKQTW